MSNLTTLLNQRNAIYSRGSETAKSGSASFYYTFTDTATGRCQFCWSSPGTGCAVLEVWGTSGGGGLMCCCSGPGVPGNPGGYSRKYIRVCGTSFICGWAGCSVQPTSLCYGGRGNCSVACVFNSGDNSTVAALAGFGGYSACTTSTSQFCCMGACAFCFTQIGGDGCGIVCNHGGPNAATCVGGSGRDISICGGISCTRYCLCFNCQSCGYEHTLAISPGIHSQDSSSFVRFRRNATPMQFGLCGATSGRMDQNLGVRAFTGVLPQFYQCWNSANRDCGCYEWQSCYYNGSGVPGIGGVPCAGVRAHSTRGGHGAVRITFYN
jgi:hypothetical protein